MFDRFAIGITTFRLRSSGPFAVRAATFPPLRNTRRVGAGVSGMWFHASFGSVMTQNHDARYLASLAHTVVAEYP